MDISALTSSTATATQTAAERSGAKLADDFDTFLTLLTTQMQNQDPMDPMKSNEFTQQLVSFTGVEQQIQTNKNLENLASVIAVNTTASAASFLGQEAMIKGDLAENTGTGATWQYGLSSSAQNVTLKVLNDAGSTIFEADGNNGLGTHAFNWAGVNNAGTAVPPGAYQLVVSAVGDDGNSVPVDVYVQDMVKSVDTRGAEPVFQVGVNTATNSQILQLLAGG